MPKETKPTSPTANNGDAPACDPATTCCPPDFDLSPCRIVKVNGTLQIKATEREGFPAGSYEWTTASDKIVLQNDKSSTVTVKAKDKPGSGKESETIKVKRSAAGCSDITKEVKVTVAKVSFGASGKQKYGYDDYDTPADTTDDHICVKKSDNTFVKVKIEGGAVGTDFDWVCEPREPCTPGAADASASFDLQLDGGAFDKRETTLHARSKCPGKESFASIKVHVYKEKFVEVIVAKIKDSTVAGTALHRPGMDAAAHTAKVNEKLKEAVVKFDITNFDAANGVTDIRYDLDGNGALSFDINASGGAELTAIKNALTGTGTKTRIAIVKRLKSYYYLSDKASIGDTVLKIRGGSVFDYAGFPNVPLDLGAKQEPVTVASVSGGEITLSGGVKKEHAVGAPIEFIAAGWSSDPIIITEENASDGSLLAEKDILWAIPHEVGHRVLTLADVNDTTNFMNSQMGPTDYRLRYCPRVKTYKPAEKENQWERIPRT